MNDFFKPEAFKWLLDDLGSSSKIVEIADFCNKLLKERGTFMKFLKKNVSI